MSVQAGRAQMCTQLPGREAPLPADIMAIAVTPSPPLDQMVTLLDRILTRSGMRP
jgi:hypothetical protein